MTDHNLQLRLINTKSVLPSETVALAKGAGGGEHIRGDDFFEKALELAFRETDAVDGFEFLAEVALQQVAVGDVRAVGVFKLR